MVTKQFELTQVEIYPGGCDRRGSYTLRVAIDKLVKVTRLSSGNFRVQVPVATPTTFFVLVREWLKRLACKPSAFGLRGFKSLPTHHGPVTECLGDGLQTRSGKLDSFRVLHFEF